MTQPEPLVPADVDLRDFGYMPLDALRLRDSELAIEASPEVFRASVLLWCAAWHQVPAGSLPNKDKTLAEYSRAGARWPRIRAEVLARWVECTDGRLYHAVVAEKAREAQSAKDAQRARTKAATEAREAKRRATHPPPDGQRDDSRYEQRDVERNVVQGKGTEGKGREGIKEKKASAPPSLTVSDLQSEGLSAETATELLALRQRKAARLTALAWTDIKAEIERARWTPERAVKKMLARGWTGFESDWVKDEKTRRADLAGATVPSAETDEQMRARLDKDQMSAEEWASSKKARELAMGARTRQRLEQT